MNAWLLRGRRPSRLLFCWPPGAASAAGCAGCHRHAGRQPRRGADPRHRRLDAAPAVPDAGRHAAAPGHRLARAGAASAHAGPVHLLLRRAALPVLRLARHGLDLAAILRDIPKRPFILVGTPALLLMLPLAATSFEPRHAGARRARWQALHRAVYAIALLGLLHFFWMRAARTTSPRWRSMPSSWACCSAGAVAPQAARLRTPDGMN
jgi:hypothetical protein